jgi:hypothetical protein
MAYNDHIAEADLELWRRRAPRAGYWFNVLPNHPQIDPLHIPNNQGAMYPNAPGFGHPVPPMAPQLQPPAPVPVFDARHAPPQVPAVRTGMLWLFPCS